VVALNQEQVSVTCEVSPRGRERWWLTKESGQPPAECGGWNCWPCSGFKIGTEPEVRAYLAVKVGAQVAVFKGRCDTVFFAPLQTSELDAVRELLPRLLEVSRWEGDGEGSTDLDQWLDTGAGYGSAGPVNPFSRWSNHDKFSGVFPDGKDEFFTGVTDAVGVTGFSRSRWLRCNDSKV
jgi:hypothetical protein